MLDLSEADPLTVEMLFVCNHYPQYSTEHKQAALRATSETLDAMATVEAQLDARGQWQATDNGLIQVSAQTGN